MLAYEAASIMYKEGVKQYFDAKLMANKRIFKKGGAKANQFRHKDLPSNGEISVELAKLVDLFENDKDERLLALRETAINVMRELLAVPAMGLRNRAGHNTKGLSIY